jgi:hypothetical protein
MFNSIAPVKRGAASSAPHAVVADHSFMAASGCAGMCMCMREQQCRALSAYYYACFQDPEDGYESMTSIPKVRLRLFYIQTQFARRLQPGAQRQEAGQ